MQSDSYQIVKVKTCPKCGSRRINRRARIKGYVCRPVGYTCKECRSNFISPVFKEVKRSTVSMPFYLKNKRSRATKTEWFRVSSIYFLTVVLSSQKSLCLFSISRHDFCGLIVMFVSHVLFWRALMAYNRVR